MPATGCSSAKTSESRRLRWTSPMGSAAPTRGKMSTQQIFGLVLTDISRNAPDVVERLVTVSPDVASSTNLGELDQQGRRMG